MKRPFLRFAFRLALIFVSALASSEARAGRLVSAEKITSYSRRMVDIAKRASGSLKELVPSRNAVDLYRVIYWTADVSGREGVQASGLVVLPAGSAPEQRLPVLSYQHGTSVSRKDVPSEARTHPEAIAAYLVFASMGYVVAAPDYLGLGAAPGPHPFLHARSEATAAADLLEATRELAARSGIKLSGDLFLAGYSQGGHATMALHRYLENERGLSVEGEGWRIRASAPMAGPYDLSESAWQAGLVSRSPRAPFYGTYLLFSMSWLYGVPVTPAQALIPQVASAVVALLDGTRGTEEVIHALPKSPAEVFVAEFVEQLKSNPAHPFLKALAENNVYDWKPEAPVRFFHGKADQDVPYRGAEVALRRMRERGAASVELVNLGDGLDHETSVVPAFLGAYRWFEGFR